jgi:hypothetical protein
VQVPAAYARQSPRTKCNPTSLTTGKPKSLDQLREALGSRHLRPSHRTTLCPLPAPAGTGHRGRVTARPISGRSNENPQGTVGYSHCSFSELRTLRNQSNYWLADRKRRT